MLISIAPFFHLLRGDDERGYGIIQEGVKVGEKLIKDKRIIIVSKHTPEVVNKSADARWWNR